jgi:molybdate transport system substrate-binding protein
MWRLAVMKRCGVLIRLLLRALCSAAVIVTPAIAQSESKAELKFLCAGALKAAMGTLLQEFASKTGNQVQVAYGPIGQNAQRIRNGEVAELAVISPEQWDGLRDDGKIDGQFRVVVGKVGIGTFVRKGAPRPGIATVEAFKRALLDAPAIAVGDPARGTPVGAYVLPLFGRLGIAEAVKPKLRLAVPGTDAGTRGSVYDLVRRGDAEIGFAQMAEASEVPEVDLVAPLPAEIQHYTIFTLAIPLRARDPARARVLADFLTSVRAVSVLKAKGIDPG